MAVALAGKIREGRGKGFNRRLRAQGELPAVIYGKKSNVSVTIHPKQLQKILDEGGINVLIDLAVAGDTEKKRTVVLKEHQEHPFKEGWFHADFLEIDMKKIIKVQVPILLVGHSPGEKMGGIVEHNLHALSIKCLPGDIPESIAVQMADVQLDQVVHVSDLTIPENSEVLDLPSEAVVSVHEVKIKEEVPEEGEEVLEEGAEAAEGAEGAEEAPTAEAKEDQETKDSKDSKDSKEK